MVDECFGNVLVNIEIIVMVRVALLLTPHKPLTLNHTPHDLIVEYSPMLNFP